MLFLPLLMAGTGLHLLFLLLAPIVPTQANSNPLAFESNGLVSSNLQPISWGEDNLNQAPLQLAQLVTPTFAPRYFGNVNNTHSIALGDVNGDGALDIVQGNYHSPGVVYVNDGAGEFGAGTPFGGFNDSYSIALGDVNGDGALDIVQGYSNAPSVVYVNDGAGGFGAGAPFGGALNAFSIALGDVNGDGALDIVQGNYGFLQQSMVYLNDGAGGFDAGTPFGGMYSTYSVALGDVNGDGALDIVQGNSGFDQQNVIYLNDGAGGFGAEMHFSSASYTSGIALGDVNGDAALDIVLGSTIAQTIVYLNDGAGGFGVEIPFGGVNPIRGHVLGDMNGDGTLDVVQGNHGQPGVVYLNDGVGGFGAEVSFGGVNNTSSVALGDMNGDGALDIVQGNIGAQSVVYLSDGVGGFGVGTPFGGANKTFDIGLGDMNGDGALDIVQGNGCVNGICQQSMVYLNDGVSGFGVGTPFGGANYTQGITLGDVNGDGALDIVQGNGCLNGICQQSMVYVNDGAGGFGAEMPFGGANYTFDIALGDVNGDGALDIVQGNFGTPSMVYVNDGAGGFGAEVPFGGVNYTFDIALGDVNGDGALDILQGNSGLSYQSMIYLNDGSGGFGMGMSFGAANYTYSLALGDVNGDGALDVVQGNAGIQSMVYLNDGTGGFDAGTPFGGANPTVSIALGDVNGDGALDIVQGNYASIQESVIYLNDGAGGFGAGTSLGGAIFSWGIALGDMNGDGTLDIVQANQNAPSVIYLNTRFPQIGLPNNPNRVNLQRPGRTHNADFFSASDIISSAVIPITYTLFDPEGDLADIRAYYSLDGGGHWLPVAPTTNTLTSTLVSRRYFKATGLLTPTLTIPDQSVVTTSVGLTATSPLTITDVNVWVALTHTQASDLRLVLQSPTGVTATLMSPGTLSGTLTQTLRFDNAALTSILSATAPYGGTFRPTGILTSFNNLNAYGNWTLHVEDTATGITGTLRAWGLEVQNDAGQHLFNWDIANNGVFGQSDNVVFRIEAYPSLSSGPNSVPVFQRSYASATTFPFRVRGTQVRVMSDTLPVSEAIVYRLPATQTVGALPFSDGAGRPYRTDGQGYLQGRGQLAIGDQLAAVLPITWTASYTLYLTSAAPTLSGLDLQPVSVAGVQILTVSATHPLLVFNLDVSLEWDARTDPQFLEQLQFNLRRASEVLFDATDGQAVLGDVRIFQAKANWDNAHIRIYATNRLRPFASIGGVVSEPLTDPVTSTVVYLPGQLHIGPTWNRYGNPGVTLGEDWPRTLAHELGHYLLFQEDDYLGLDANRDLIPVETCVGTLMADPYRDDYSELHPSAGWEANCADTLANQITGRSDWESVNAFYPWLNAPGPINVGPTSLPLAITQISFVEPTSATTVLDDPRFYLSYNGSYQPGKSASTFLFRANDIVELGGPVVDQVLARGAAPGDRLCVFETTAGLQGCKVIVANDNQELPLSAVADWQPEVIITPVNTRTVSIQVGHVPTTGLTLQGRLYGNTGLVSSLNTLSLDNEVYTTTFTFTDAVLGGLAYVWVSTDPLPNPRAVVAEYTLGGNPANARSGFANARSGFANARSGFAPVLSGDGQVILYTADITFALGTFYAVQGATYLPNVPTWATVVGKGYHLLASTGAPDLSSASISLSYAETDVPVGGEPFLKVYAYDTLSQTWLALTSTVNADDNSVLAVTAPGPGLYALMTAIEIPLYGPGWDLFSYPVQVSQGVTLALESISGMYGTVYWYDGADPSDPWKLYDAGVPTYVVDLFDLRFGEAYWISMTQNAILRLNGAPSTSSPTVPSDYPLTPQRGPSLETPPATYYGDVIAGQGFTPAPGLVVRAFVGSVECGQGQTLMVDGQVVYSINVLADGSGTPGCGADGRLVTFVVDERRMWATLIWSNAVPQAVTLFASQAVYLPFIQR